MKKSITKNNLLDTFVEVESIFIIGRRWFEKTNGNTYHTSEIYVNNNFVHKISMTYGYGQQYLWTALNWLKNNKYLSSISEKDNPSIFCRENNIKLNHTVADVGRKKDL
jgi:hypothetical protein